MELAKILILLPIICSSKPLNELDQHVSMIDIPLVTFDGKESTTFSFHELNDPVMVRKYTAFQYFQLMKNRNEDMRDKIIYIIIHREAFQLVLGT